MSIQFDLPQSFDPQLILKISNPYFIIFLFFFQLIYLLTLHFFHQRMKVYFFQRLYLPFLNFFFYLINLLFELFIFQHQQFCFCSIFLILTSFLQCHLWVNILVTNIIWQHIFELPITCDLLRSISQVGFFNRR